MFCTERLRATLSTWLGSFAVLLMLFASGALLTIEPGAVVSMTAGAKLTVQSGGIQTVGTTDKDLLPAARRHGFPL